MTRDPEPIGEQDLQAYGDGLLDHDPVRKRDVEEWLRTRPVEANRLWNHRKQNAMIAERYEDIASEPVPDRLYRALEGRPHAHGLARAAAIVGVMLASGLLGWSIGQQDEPVPGGRVMALLSATAQPVAAAAGKAIAGSGAGQPLGWLSDQITIPLHLPDLTALGYSRVDKRLVSSRAGQAVEILYARSDGKRVVLLLAPRWADEPSDPKLVERDGLRIAYGFKGPIGYGVAGDLDEDSIRRVAEAVRRSWDGVARAKSAAVEIEGQGLSAIPVNPLAHHPRAVRDEGAMGNGAM